MTSNSVGMITLSAYPLHDQALSAMFGIIPPGSLATYFVLHSN